VLTEKQSDRRPVRRTSWISYPILWTPCEHQIRPTYPSPPHSRRSSDATRAWPKSLAWKTIPNAVPNPGSSRTAEVKCSLTDGKTQREVPRPTRPPGPAQAHSCVRQRYDGSGLWDRWDRFCRSPKKVTSMPKNTA